MKAQTTKKQPAGDIPGLLKDRLSAADIDPAIAAIYLYGSAVAGRLRKDSDIDVAFLMSPKLRSRLYRDDPFEICGYVAKVEGYIAAALAGTPWASMDVSVLDMRSETASISLLDSVARDGRLLFCRDEAQRLAFESYVFKENEHWKTVADEMWESRHGR